MVPDWMLCGGEVIDGQGGARFFADVHISAGRISAIVPRLPDAAVGISTGSISGTPVPEEPVETASLVEPVETQTRILDVTGLVVAPGFIDMHAHSDLAVLADPQHLAKVQQGVTLEVVGQDGLGYSPVTDATMASTRAQIAGWNGAPEIDYSWRSVADYLARVDSGTATNVAVLVPHGTARMNVMGMDAASASPEQLERIRAYVDQGMRDGAVGMSTGLTYAPGMYASDAELEHALGAVRAHGGYYCPHHRNYGAEVVQGYADCLALAVRAGVPLHLAHCHVNFPLNAGRAPEVLAAIDAAIAAGGDVTLDAYPYLSSATYLSSMLPGWAQSEGAAVTLALLADPAARARILHELEVTGSDGQHGVPVDWQTISISAVADPANAWAVGRTIADLAAERGTSPGELFADLLIADRLGPGCLMAVGNAENMEAVMLHAAHTVGTDGILVGEKPHPRGWGSFPLWLGHFARDRGLLSLEQAVLHATSRPAARLGLVDRGVVAVGHWADLVVFDPDAVGSSASYGEPTLPPTGIPHVFVNGVPTLLDGRRTTDLPGRAIRGRGASSPTLATQVAATRPTETNEETPVTDLTATDEGAEPEALCIGETMVMLVPELGEPLAQTASVAVHIGGAESNVAAGLARLGVNAEWFSRLGADPLAERILAELRERGVDTRRVAIDDGRPTGLYFKDQGSGSSRVHYYRKGSAASALAPADLAGLALERRRLVHVSGITAALSASCDALLQHVIVQRATSAATVSFDVNYRPTLWSVAEAAPRLLELSRAADIVIVGRDEAETLWGTTDAASVRALIPDAAELVVKDAEFGATQFDASGATYVPALRVDVVEAVGAGDAFAAGYLAAWLRGADTATALRLGHVMAGYTLGAISDIVELPPRDALYALAETPDELWPALRLPAAEPARV
ncbi:PfkB family carbohydrate kinase [Microterricola viridarii]|uniref:PfkB family carbohydrate kinase n=1 Tax=Microterricola viridarii TaxID=412690 RepID=UPI0009EC9FEC|nr:PfkB family carbohydrate kinase [Microterricola viridarii]